MVFNVGTEQNNPNRIMVSRSVALTRVIDSPREEEGTTEDE
jgi:hypothetical protein